MGHFVEFENVCKYYTMGEQRIAAADHVNFTIEKGEFAIIVGPSGAGKTTVLNMLGGMDTCDEGAIRLDGQEISKPLATGCWYSSSQPVWLRPAAPSWRQNAPSRPSNSLSVSHLPRLP